MIKISTLFLLPEEIQENLNEMQRKTMRKMYLPQNWIIAHSRM